MKKLKLNKEIYKYTGTDAEAINFLNAFKEVFGVELLPFLGSQPISTALGDTLRAFEENADDILPEVGTNNRQQIIDSGALPLLLKINGQVGGLVGYLYSLKNWYSNKLTTGKIVLDTPNFGKEKYIYVPNKVYTQSQKLAAFNYEFDAILRNLGVPANKTAGSIAAWETYLTNPTEGNRMKQLDSIYYTGFWNDFFSFYKNKRLMAASGGSRIIGGGAGAGAGVGTGDTVNIDPSGGGAGLTDSFVEGDMTETEALQFLYEIEKFSPINWGNLDYWYKQLMAKKNEVSKEVFNFAYDFWLKKLNKHYETFSPMEKEKEKERHALINGYVYEKPKKVKKYGLFATIIRAIFKKK